MSEIQKSVQLLTETLAGKNHDYTAGRGEFYNFEKSAEFVNIHPQQAMLVEVAKKMTRIESLLRLEGLGQLPNNESLKDSLLDAAGYLVITHAHISAEEKSDGCDRLGFPR